MGKVIVKFEYPGMTPAVYDKIINEMKSNGTIRQQKRLDHIAGQTKSGLFIMDVWESEEAFREFGKVLMPVFRKLEIPLAEPEILPLYNEIH